MKTRFLALLVIGASVVFLNAFSFNFKSLIPSFCRHPNANQIAQKDESVRLQQQSFILAQEQQPGLIQKGVNYLWDATQKKVVTYLPEKKDDDETKKKEPVTTQLWNITKKQLKPYWDMVNYDEFKKQYIKAYEGQTVGQDAFLQKGIKITNKGSIDAGTPEGKFLARRMDRAFSSLPAFIGHGFKEKNEVPRIGIALSGGGYRAMVLSSGYLKALEDMQLLDSALYIATLSGSTWYLGPWAYQQGPDKKTTVKQFNEKLLKKIEDKHFDLLKDTKKDFNVQLFASQVTWPKMLYEQSIASVDIYGAALSHFLLYDLGDKRLITRLSGQQYNVETGNTPFPIYTAVAQVKGDPSYDWYEFNPWHVRNLEHDYAVQSYGLGRKFENGKSVKQQGSYPPEQAFGFLMGTFGSAFTINLNDVIRILFGLDVQSEKDYPKKLAQWFGKSIEWAKKGISNLPQYFKWARSGEFKKIWDDTSANISQIQGTILVSFLQIVSDIVIKKASEQKIKVGGKEITVGSTRFVPAQVNNPFKGFTDLDSEWLQEQEVLTFVDAGISYNIPLRPLFRPERDLDIIIIGDASGDALVGPLELDKALADIKRYYGLEYVKDEKSSTDTMMIYRSLQKIYPNAGPQLAHVEAPIIVYFNFVKDDALITKASEPGNNHELQRIVLDNKLTEFDPVECLSKGFCSTFNFAYTVDGFKQLSGLGEFNIRAHEEALKKFVQEAAENRRKEEEGGFGG